MATSKLKLNPLWWGLNTPAQYSITRGTAASVLAESANHLALGPVHRFGPMHKL